jgi:hypothetical protein
MTLPFSVEDLAVWLTPLAAGGAYAIALLIAAHAVAALGHWLASGRALRPQSVLPWTGWGYLRRLASILYACGFLGLALVRGWFDPADVGLRPPDWASLAAWMPPLLGLVTLWLALQWGAAWWQTRPTANAASSLGWHSLWELPGESLGHEAQLGILRAAIVPLLGAAPGVWLAPALKGGVALLTPGGARLLRDSSSWPWALLQLALDWLSTSLWLVSGSVWPGLLARLVESLAIMVLYGLLRRRALALHSSSARIEQAPW